jgi:trehalose 6-phosphate synthase/phosphatase
MSFQLTTTRHSFSMEYIICQQEPKGPLIVSEFTGVSAALTTAIKVNPWDLGVS